VTVARIASRTVATLGAQSVPRTGRGRLTATVTATGLVPTGTVQVFEGTTRRATGTLLAGNRGRITLTLPRLAPGRHRLVVRYLGSTGAAPSTSAAATLTVRR
jgi:hypothetical protein